jgi:hypothetical protein
MKKDEQFNKEIYEVYDPTALEFKDKPKNKKEIGNYENRFPDTLPKEVGDTDTSKIAFVYTKMGTWMDEKSFDKMYIKPFNYDIARVPKDDKYPDREDVGLTIKERMKSANIDKRLRILYSKFKDFECDRVDDSQSHGIKVNTIRFSMKWRQQSEHNLPYLNVITKTNDEIIINSIAYHREFTKLKNVEYNQVDNFKKYVKSLELTDWKEKVMRGNDDGFVHKDDSIIIWNKFGDKKNGSAYISKMIFKNKE